MSNKLKMQYKKIVLNLNSGFITPWESDTILSYAFSWGFLQDNQEIKNIFQDFVNGKLAFLITNGFVAYGDDVYITKPIFFSEKKEKQDFSLKEAIQKESSRKKFKKADKILFKKDNLEKIFSNQQLDDTQKQEFIEQKENYNKYFKEDEIWKNSIPRFNSGDTNPYAVEANFANQIVVYVKVFDEEKFNKFFEFMKNILETIGYGAGKSRGFGKVEKVELDDLNNDEKETFNYLENLKKQGKYLVLNNYRPTDEELENIDLGKSFVDINWKNTKTTQELNANFFKGRMNFIKEGTVLSINGELKGSYYKNGDSYNFGFIF